MIKIEIYDTRVFKKKIVKLKFYRWEDSQSSQLTFLFFFSIKLYYVGVGAFKRVPEDLFVNKRKEKFANQLDLFYLYKNIQKNNNYKFLVLN